MNKTCSICLFDLETESKTIIDDTFCSIDEQSLQVKAWANVLVEELYLSFNNCYIGGSMFNTQVVSHPCENNPMIENALDDSIDGLSISLVEGS